MRTSGQIWKKIFAGIMIIIYLGGVFTPSMIYFVHDVYHIMTHTVYQHLLHEYQHFKGIAHDHSTVAEGHGHTHNMLIDFALHQIDTDKNRQPDHRQTPKTLTTFKYNEHVKGNNVSLRQNYTARPPYVTGNTKAEDLAGTEPVTPPPKCV